MPESLKVALLTEPGGPHQRWSGVRADAVGLSGAERIEELARMLAGSAITAKTRAHAKELFQRHRRGD